MATIKAIEAKSVHQIQSGQVIVDLCSVVKELVENSLDAGATYVEVRFKNNGLDAIEVQDNGSGIAESNYENLALKHYTSKLSNYDDLSTLQTFGFRGEALSSLCALSHFSVMTAQAHEAPKGKKLIFEQSGKLKSISVVACQKGTTAIVEYLFEQLPVRRKELSKNIKREYQKVLGLLQAYACISTNVKFSVKNATAKSKSMTAFSTNGNYTTRENIANVYGAKTLTALVPLDLELDFQSSETLGQKPSQNSKIHVSGHISKPVFGEGRQAPDRQMFFVNGRPCGLPQIGKAMNEVYKSFNVSQTPFILADFQMNTNAYDVNVSPDKRTILLHNAAAVIESLKTALNEMFDEQEQTVPQSTIPPPKLPSFRQLTVQRLESDGRSEVIAKKHPSNSQDSIGTEEMASESDADSLAETSRIGAFRQHFDKQTTSRDKVPPEASRKLISRIKQDEKKRIENFNKVVSELNPKAESLRGELNDWEKNEDMQDDYLSDEAEESTSQVNIHVRDFNNRMAEQQQRKTSSGSNSDEDDMLPQEPAISSIVSRSEKETAGVVGDAFNRMRPRRIQPEIATITIGDKTVTTIVGSQGSQIDDAMGMSTSNSETRKVPHHTISPTVGSFSRKLRRFDPADTRASYESDHDMESDNDVHTSADNEEVDRANINDQASLGLASVDGNEIEGDVSVDELYGDNSSDSGSDSDYVDEDQKKAQEEARVANLIKAAEESAAGPKQANLRRANKALNTQAKDSTVRMLAISDVSIDQLRKDIHDLLGIAQSSQQARVSLDENMDETIDTEAAEARLSLTVSKSDFSKMLIVGQFNLGFILAIRPANESASQDHTSANSKDELFIIDQHASDEKYNFERLQAETVVGNQRLVRPGILDLTALEEEIIIENRRAFETNGFIIEIDTSGEAEVGRRCKLLSLPLSKEVIFGSHDLDELIHLLAETPLLGVESSVPRPSKVRKMFAMRACRSSIMIGKTLSKKQMNAVVSHMGTIDKPWNCPHGRPTMRHIVSLDSIGLWQEGNGLLGMEDVTPKNRSVWRNYLATS